jgi:hypothetical protein
MWVSFTFPREERKLRYGAFFAAASLDLLEEGQDFRRCYVSDRPVGERGGEVEQEPAFFSIVLSAALLSADVASTSSATARKVSRAETAAVSSGAHWRHLW